MSAFGMKPTFRNWSEYQEWKTAWRVLYRRLTADIRDLKRKTKAAQREGQPCGRLQKELGHMRAMAWKTMTLLEEARIRWQNIRDMHAGLKAQMAQFPLELPNVRNIDFHFNKKHLEFPEVPMWILKAKGQSFYLFHIDCETPWTTRELPDNPSTKGMIRIKRGTISINAQGEAVIR